MSEPRFTPGPWEAIPSVPEEGFECFWIRKKQNYSPITRGFRVTEIGAVNGPQWDEQRATAHLISAAPDMYEALKEVAERLRNCATNIEEEYPIWAGDLRKMAESAAAALTKAEGKT